MPEITEQILKSQIKDNNYMRAYLIYGSEPYLKQHYANLIPKKCIAPDMDGFNLRKFDIQNNVDIQEIIDATDTLPVFSQYNCTVIKDYPLDTIYSSDKERFEKWLREMPDTTVTVFWQDSTEINPKKNAKWKSVISLFTKYAGVLCLDRMDRSSLSKTVMQGIKKRGCDIERDTAFYLIDTVGDDLNILLNEVEKLSNFKKRETITKKDIDEICIKSLEANIFDLSKALIGGNLSKSMAVLNKLLNDKEKPELILGTLASNFIDMYRVKVSLLAGKPSDYMKGFYNYKNTEFRLRNAARDCSHIEMTTLRKCIVILSSADQEIKMRINDERIILEKLLIELYKTLNTVN